MSLDDDFGMLKKKKKKKKTAAFDMSELDDNLPVSVNFYYTEIIIFENGSISDDL